jgi:RHS repeat-associated protein
MTKILSHLQKLLALILLLCAGLGAGLLTPSQAQAGETITYIHADIAGSPIAATNAAGNLLWKESYRPYGARSQNTDQGKQAQWFTGKSLEASTSLSYFGARYYDPVVGRFMGVDPVGFMENNLHSFNRYAYGNNNPSRYLDPDGNLPILIPLAAYVFGNAAIGAGFDYAIQKAMGHTVNWGQVAFGGFAGGMLGGAGGVGASAVMNSAKASTSVVKSAPLLLQAPRQLEAAWGASVYKKGGLMTGIEHIWYRHSSSSGFSNVSHFAEGTKISDISRYVDTALRSGTVTKTGTNAYTVEYNLGEVIGTDIAGNAATNIRVFVNEKVIQSAFPF